MSARVQTIEWLNRRIDELEAEKTPLYTDRITNLQQQLNAANQRAEDAELADKYLQQTIDSMTAEIEQMGKVRAVVERDYQQRLEAAERKLASAEQIIARFGAWLDGWSVIGPSRKPSDVYGAWDSIRDQADQALAQIEQPQSTPAEREELNELRNIAVDWQRQFHALKSQCEETGFVVRYGDDGMPVLANHV